MIYLLIYLVIGIINALLARFFDWGRPIPLHIWLVELFLWPIATLIRILMLEL